MQERVHLPLVEQFAPWSPSKSDTAGQCGLKFRLQYMDKHARTTTSAAIVGVTAHRALELMLQGMPAAQAFAQAMEESPNLTKPEITSVKALRGACIKYCNRINAYKDRNPVKEEFFEKQWAVTKDFRPTDFFAEDAFFRGVVDHGLLLQNGYLIVLDHKTGRRRDPSYYGNQLDAYAVMATAHHGELRGVRTGIHFVKDEAIDWYVMRDPSYVERLLRPWLTQLLTSRADALPPFLPREGKHCKWCDFKHVCPTQVSA